MSKLIIMKNIPLTIILFGHFIWLCNCAIADERVPRFSLNVGNMTTLNLSPSRTFGSINSVTLKPHPSNSRKYEQLADWPEQDVEMERDSSTSGGKEPSASLKMSSNQCADSEFGIEFTCEPTWKWKRTNDAILIIISSKPMVTMTITKIDSPIKFLGQITDSYLRERALYAEGFQVERVKFLDDEAVYIKAISSHYPDIRLSDYLFIKNNSLYGVLFSVKPREEWDNYKFSIQEIIQSFRNLEI